MSVTIEEMVTRAVYACPDWCVRPDHDADELTLDETPYHYGPDFGRHIGIMGQGRPAATLDDENRDDLDPPALRRLAADALTAADWLEQHA